MQLHYIFEKDDIVAVSKDLLSVKQLGFDSESINAIPGEINLHLDINRLCQFMPYDGTEVFVFDSMLIKENPDTYSIYYDLLIQLLYERTLIGHNMIYDSGIMLSNYKIPIVSLHDIMAMGKLLHTPIRIKDPVTKQRKADVSISLASLAKIHLDITMNKEMGRSNWAKRILEEEQIVYSAVDVVTTLKLFDIMFPLIKSNKLSLDYEIERNDIPVTAASNVFGVLVNEQKIVKLKTETEVILESLKQEIEVYFKPKLINPEQDDLFGAGFVKEESVNLDSPKQVISELLKLGIEVKSTSVEILEHIKDKHPVITPLIKYGSVSTRYGYLKAYYDNRDSNNYVYPTIGQFYTVTGRKNSSEPINIMNVPKQEGFRNVFVPEEGYSFIIADYNAIETRIVASITGCKRMAEIFNKHKLLTPQSTMLEVREADLHYIVAAQNTRKSILQITKPERDANKQCTYLFQYGGSIKKYIETLEKLGVHKEYSDAKDDKSNWFKLFPEIAEWQEENTARYGLPAEYRTNNSIRTITGRLLRFDATKPFIATEALNYQIQPVTASGIKYAEAKIYENLLEQALEDNFKTRIVIQNHDELVVQCLDSEIEKTSNLVKHYMETCMETLTKRLLPMEVELKVAKEWIK